MSTPATDWAWAQRGLDGEPLAANLRLALLALARAADGKGFFTLRRKEIGDLLQCSLDTVDRRIKALERERLLNVERVPRKNGYGPSKYTLAILAADRSPAATREDEAGRTVAAQGERRMAARGNADLRPDEAAKVAALDAASIRKPSSTVEEETQLEELNPDTEESSINHRARDGVLHVLNGSAKSMPGHALASIIVDQVNSPWLDPNKHHTLGRSIGRIRGWIDAGADFDSDVLPTITAICGRASGPIRTWGYFTDAIRQAAAQRLAAEAPMEIITAQEANNDGQRTDRSSIGGFDIKRGKINASTAVLLRQMYGDGDGQ